MKQYKKNYPYYDIPQVRDLKELVNRAATLYNDKTAYKFKVNDTITQKSFTQLKHDIDSLGTALIDLGMTNDHCAIYAGNSYEWINTFICVINSSGVVVPVDRELMTEEVGNVVENGDVSILFYGASYEEKVKALVPRLSNVKYYIGFDLEEDKGNFLSFKKLIAHGAKLLDSGDTRYTDIPIALDDMTSIVFTSGTTGVSKGVMLSQRNLISDVLHAMESTLIEGVSFSVLPYNHTYESTLGVFCMIHQGMTICINENIRAFLTNIKLYKPNVVLLVPLFVESMYKRIWKQAEDTGKDKMLRALMAASKALMKAKIDMRRVLFKSVLDNFGGNLNKLIVGGACVKPHICEFFEAMGIQVCVGYGITECSPLVSVNRDYFLDHYSAGVPIPGCEVRINEPDEVGEGEIYVRGDNVMLGYYKRPDLTEAAFDNGWFKTGDIGKVDSLGRVYITGRKKNLIVLNNGKNVYPEEIESYFDESTTIGEIMVCARSDKDGSEVAITAEVFPNPNFSAGKTPDAVETAIRAEIEAVNAKLPMYKQIKRVSVRDKEFDKTTTKKIKRYSANAQ